MMKNEFDPHEKENELRKESESWDTSNIQNARPDDIPVVDVSDYLGSNSDDALDSVAAKLGQACRNVGFFSLTGHHFSDNLRKQMFEQARAFHSLGTDEKATLTMDRPDWPVKGVGYMPYRNRKLPTRAKGNLNEAFIIKRDHVATMSDNQWPATSFLPDFRAVVEQYAAEIERLALKLLPIYARALGLHKEFFAPAFTKPLFRLRMTHYPPVHSEDAEYGIAPHVDTTFFTILAQDKPGLVIFSEERKCWIYAPLVEDAFIVNTGELLKQWSNDVFISVKHFANNNIGEQSRFSIPFFFNANGDYKMECLPTCCSKDNPARYPAISYLESQAVAQGE